MPWTYQVTDNKMEVYSGILTIKSPKLLKTKLFNNYWCILYPGRGTFSPRLDLYEEKPQVGQTPCKKTIYLEEAKWVKSDSLDPAFSFVVKHSKQYIFVTACKSEVSLWILFLCCVSKDLFDSKHIIGIEDLNKMDNYQTEDGEEYVVKENILYCSSSELSTFIVVAHQTESCVQHGWKGLFKLRIGDSAVELLQHDSERELASWPLMLLKKYGHNQHTFFFEAGARSVTGKGKFSFQTTQGEKITECLVREAQLCYNKSHRSDKSSVTEVSKQSVKFDAENTVRAKPPTPPQKPNSSSFRRSLPENIHYPNGQQASKKGIPAFGVQVFIPPAQQFSNEVGHNYGVAPEDCKNTNREDVNDLPVNSADENNTRPLLQSSSSYQPSESGSTKEGKKAQKEWKREQKKREEEEKKERKRQEEEKKKQQKKREEEEKRIKKEQKKQKQKEAKRPSISSRSASLSDSKVSVSGPENFSSYTEVDISGVSAEPSIVTEKIYSEPWGALPYLAIPPSGDGCEVEYAQPEKRPVHQTAAIVPREVTHIEHYEAVQITDPEYSAPLVIPPKWEETGEDSGTDVYSHLNEGKSTVVQENLYGMASASPVVTVFEDENPYENNDSTYECVG